MSRWRDILTGGQLAALAAEAREPLMEEINRRQKVEAINARWHPADTAGSREPAVSDGRSRVIVGRMFGVGHVQVGRAHAIREKDPGTFRAASIERRGRASDQRLSATFPKPFHD